MNINKQRDTNHHTILSAFTVSKDDLLLLYNKNDQELTKTHDEILLLSKTNLPQALELTKKATKKYHDEPIFAYHLERLYLENKDNNLAEQTAEDNYRKFPLYLLTRCRYALVLLNKNKLMEAASSFNYIFDLKTLYPDKSSFHFIEIITFYAFVIQYFCALKDFNRATYYLTELIRLDQDLPVIAQLSQMILVEALETNLSDDNIALLFTLNMPREQEIEE